MKLNNTCAFLLPSIQIFEPAIGFFFMWFIFNLIKGKHDPGINQSNVDLRVDERDLIDFSKEPEAIRNKENVEQIKIDYTLLERLPQNINDRVIVDEGINLVVKETKTTNNIPEGKNNAAVAKIKRKGKQKETAILDSAKMDSRKLKSKQKSTGTNFTLRIPSFESHPLCRNRIWKPSSLPASKFRVVGYTHLMHSTPCQAPACDLNKDRTPLQMNFNHTPCKLHECVTVTIKTRFRYGNVMTFIKSIKHFYPGLKVIVLDEDGREKFTIKSMIVKWEKFINANQNILTYVKSKPGMGYGRQLGAELAKTKYILVADDDFYFGKQSNITKLLELIEMSDADIVAGETYDSIPFAGAMRVGKNATNSPTEHLALYPNIYYEPVQCFKYCFAVDIAKNFFIASRQTVLQHGGWDVERTFYEREDFFINMRKARLKVVHCRDVIVQHAHDDQTLVQLRRESYFVWHKHLFKKWKFNDMFMCDKFSYADNENTCAVKQYLV